MAGSKSFGRSTVQLGGALAAVLALTACDDNGNFSFGGGADGETAALDNAPVRGVEMVSQDVEAPEVFSVTEAGLWDGRPSLGGVWVAHPDVQDPERVIIRNQANGQFVIGALFRRERDNPGPALQVSSDAAEELGMLAGAPATLNVVALRREEGPAATPVATTDFDAPTDLSAVAPAEVTATSLDAAPVETASLDGAADASVAPAAPAPAAADPVFNASAAIAEVEAAARAAQAAPATAPVAAAAPAPAATSTLERPYIQIGIFSVEANANATATRMRDAGLSARVLAQESQGRAFWRVIVGPAPTAEDRAAVLSTVQGLGFTDAYAVTN